MPLHYRDEREFALAISLALGSYARPGGDE